MTSSASGGLAELRAGRVVAETQVGSFFIWLSRGILCTLLAVTPLALVYAATGPPSARAFLLFWAIGVVSGAHGARNAADQVVVDGDAVTFRCVRGSLHMPVSQVHAISDQPLGWATGRRTTVFETERGKITPWLGDLRGMPEVVDALVQRNPGIRTSGPPCTDPPPVTPEAKRLFQSGVLISLGWTGCGIGAFIAAPLTGAGLLLLGVGYAAVAAAAFLLARSGLCGDAPAHGLRSEHVVSAGVRAYGLSPWLTPWILRLLLLAPLAPWMARWLTERS